MHVTKTSETQSQTEQVEPAAAPSKRSTRKSIMALSVFALAINGTAAIYTLPSFEIPLPDVGSLAELLPHQKASAPTPDPVVAALKDIQSAQQQHVASLQENNSSLQQNIALLQQDSTTLASLRESITDEHVDVKKISTQLSTLIAKVDSLQNTIAPETTSSIPKAHSHNRLTGVLRKRMARQPAPLGPVSVGGAPLSFPVITPSPQG
jgi:TolA-binding protein